MKKFLATLALVAALPATAVRADDHDCGVPADRQQAWVALTQLAADYDWTINWVEMDDGCYEIQVTDVGGNALKAEVDPATLQVIEARIRFREDGAAAAQPGVPAPATGSEVPTPPASN